MPVVGTAIGAGVGAVAGGALGYFSSSDAPEYEQPAMDPAYALLMEGQKQQQIRATQYGVRREQASLDARYGANPSAGQAAAPSPTSMDPASLLARYGAMLAKAPAGG